MKVGIVVMLFLVVFLSSLMMFFLFPFNSVNFNMDSGNSNFSINQSSNQLQFYPNMRFPDSQISYRISDCPLQRQNDMEYAFLLVENITPLVFYPVTSNEEILVTCQDTEKFQGGLIIAGEGGPKNITVAGDFNVITNGEVLLIKESTCPKPNIAMHELFHVLGFDHSRNPGNIMYNVSFCDQTIGDDMIQELNRLYSVQSKPDLLFQNASATLSGRFLSINMTVTNAGLAKAEVSAITIYADGKVVKEINLDSLPIGTGRMIMIQNIFVPKIVVKELELNINNNFDELSKENNKIKLEIK